MLPNVQVFQRLGTGALKWLYPSKCALCGRLAENSPCLVCASEMEPARPNFLAEPVGSPLAFRACVFAYAGRSAQAVRKLKYARSTSLAEFVASKVAERVAQVADEDEIVVPVPIHRSRRTSRGFNQAEMCAERVARLAVRPNLLRRVRATRPQAGLSLKEREENLVGAFEASPECAGRSILLIDDVVTSGQTARACAVEMRRAGALSVSIVAFSGNLE